MKKITAIIVALVVIAAAILVAVVIDGNQASAYPWTGGCGNCHTAATVHAVPAHAAVFPSNCAACHEASPPAKANVDAGSCAVATCHVSVTALAQNASHASAGCTVTGCHPAATTTTTQPVTTTTQAPTTTTTQAPTTTRLRPAPRPLRRDHDHHGRHHNDYGRHHDHYGRDHDHYGPFRRPPQSPALSRTTPDRESLALLDLHARAPLLAPLLCANIRWEVSIS